MREMDNTVPIKEEVTNQLKGYIGRNQRMLVNVGVGAGLYLLGRQAGFKNGYCKGYGKCFTDMFTTTNKAK